MPTCQHCSGAERAVPCPSTLFDETTASHINRDTSGEDSPELLHVIPNKQLPLHQCLVSCIYCSPILASSRTKLHYFFFLYCVISKPSCHMTILGENAGRLVLQVCLLPRDVPAAKGTCSGSLCCSNPDTPQILC